MKEIEWQHTCHAEYPHVVPLEEWRATWVENEVFLTAVVRPEEQHFTAMGNASREGPHRKGIYTAKSTWPTLEEAQQVAIGEAQAMGHLASRAADQWLAHCQRQQTGDIE